MMDETTIRRQLADFENRLAHIDDERQALQDIVKGYQTLLRAMSDPDEASSRPITFPASLAMSKASSTIVGSVSMRSTVARVLREAGGRAMHSREILEMAEKAGARTTAKDPVAVVDLVVLGLQQKGKVEKAGPRTWRWTDQT
jgi:hypothetical protein